MIAVNGVTKRYGRIQALGGVDLTVAAGSTCGIIGPNGAGKTTLLKILLGLVRADSGSIHVGGCDLHRDPVGVRRLVGYVPQFDGFAERSTGRQALAFLTKLRRLSLEQALVQAEAVGVGNLLDQPVDTLSGGQRQRLSVAAALLGDPPVLLLDEPTASLDPRAAASFRDLVNRMKADGRTIVLCSHLLPDIEKLCDRALVLLDGRVVLNEDLRAAPRQGQARTLEERFLVAVGQEEPRHEN